jgi:UDP-galactopyranose mutase
MSKVYDYLIVGAGLFGSVFANEAKKDGKSVLVVEKRHHLAGNIFTEEIEGIQVHRYGPHIFHTDNKKIWDYLEDFSEFNHFINTPLANYKGQIYNLPFNMNTFHRLWGVVTPREAKEKIESQKNSLKTEPRNLEDQAIQMVGREIYDKLIKGYTQKQWGRECTSLPPDIIRRIPLRFTYNNNYFNHRYQGIPLEGYTRIIEQMLEGCDLILSTDYLENRQTLNRTAARVLYTGTLDGFYDYQFGGLEYRSLAFETEILDQEDCQGNAIINYTDLETPYTRVIEHKHFNDPSSKKTVITREYPVEWQIGRIPYYPIRDEENLKRYQQYQRLAGKEKKVIFGGRLGMYRYYDMDQIIEEAIELYRKES